MPGRSGKEKGEAAQRQGKARNRKRNAANAESSSEESESAMECAPPAASSPDDARIRKRNVVDAQAPPEASNSPVSSSAIASPKVNESSGSGVHLSRLEILAQAALTVKKQDTVAESEQQQYQLRLDTQSLKEAHCKIVHTSASVHNEPSSKLLSLASHASDLISAEESHELMPHGCQAESTFAPAESLLSLANFAAKRAESPVQAAQPQPNPQPPATPPTDPVKFFNVKSYAFPKGRRLSISNEAGYYPQDGTPTDNSDGSILIGLLKQEKYEFKSIVDSPLPEGYKHMSYQPDSEEQEIVVNHPPLIGSAPVPRSRNRSKRTSTIVSWQFEQGGAEKEPKNQQNKHDCFAIYSPAHYGALKESLFMCRNHEWSRFGFALQCDQFIKAVGLYEYFCYPIHAEITEELEVIVRVYAKALSSIHSLWDLAPKKVTCCKDMYRLLSAINIHRICPSWGSFDHIFHRGKTNDITDVHSEDNENETSCKYDLAISYERCHLLYIPFDNAWQCSGCNEEKIKHTISRADDNNAKLFDKSPENNSLGQPKDS